jgi:isopenicillin-N N-acyltransferase-like protein
VLVHTNHYQASVPPQLAETYRPRGADTLYRLHRLEQRLSACASAVGDGGMRKLLADALQDHFGHPTASAPTPTPRWTGCASGARCARRWST